MDKNYIDVNDVNKKIEENNRKLILNNESAYRGQLFQLVHQVLKKRRRPKIICLAGPSCAGKTTTANILKEIFEGKKKKVVLISMDDFFLNREDTPLLPNGMKDYDGLRALNLKQMENCFKTLFSNGEADFPRYDFITGLNMPGEYHFNYDKNTIIIFEGLHVLNPTLLNHLGTKDFFKVYIAPSKGFKLDEFAQMSARQLRLVRRMIRDVRRRGHSPEHTLKTWKNVCDAEDIYIEPYKNDADFKINTTHDFELSFYKDNIFEIVISHRDVVQDLPFMPIVEHVISLDDGLLPDTSLMWEFIDKPIKKEQ